MLTTAIMVLAAERIDDDVPYAEAQMDYADECLALAARDLFRAVEADDHERRPIGW